MLENCSQFRFLSSMLQKYKINGDVRPTMFQKITVKGYWRANNWLRVRFGHWPRGEFTNRLHVVVFAVLVRFSSRMFFLIHFFGSLSIACAKSVIFVMERK